MEKTTQDPALYADPDYLALQDQLDYLVDCGEERSMAADAVRAKLRLLRGSYKLSKAEVKP